VYVNQPVIQFSKEFEAVSKPEPVAEKESPKSNQVINIYAGTGENVELSNFAERPVTYGTEKFRTVEGAFQAMKVDYADKSKKNDSIIDKLLTATGAESKRLGRQIEGLSQSVWDKDSPGIMKGLIKDSFEQNPDALQKLLDTGNATLTHTQDKSRWGKLFPQILMEVREELREKDSVSPNQVEVVSRYSRDEVKANPDKIYIFGDNTIRRGTGGQAQIRHNENAFGIATKLFPSNKPDSFMSDSDLQANKDIIDSDIAKIKDDGRPMVFPKDGLGTGLAKLKEKAPQTYAYLKQRLLEEFGFNNDTGAIVKKESVKPDQVTKIISGGQTGVDRIGLEVGKELGIETGGVAPKGYRTEKGPDTSLKEFGLTEDASSGYTSRTLKNLKTADGTVLFGDMKSPGSKQTINNLEKNNKPYIVNPTAKDLQKFLTDNNIKVLNVAGNRGSKVSSENAIKYAKVLKDALYYNQGFDTGETDSMEKFITKVAKQKGVNLKSLPKRKKPKGVNIQRIKPSKDQLKDDC